jgi:hypothetical protein
VHEGKEMEEVEERAQRMLADLEMREMSIKAINKQNKESLLFESTQQMQEIVPQLKCISVRLLDLFASLVFVFFCFFLFVIAQFHLSFFFNFSVLASDPRAQKEEMTPLVVSSFQLLERNFGLKLIFFFFFLFQESSPRKSKTRLPKVGVCNRKFWKDITREKSIKN